MPKHARRPTDDPSGPVPFLVLPSIELCLFHRCDRHEGVPMLNAAEEQTGSECGACVAEVMLTLKAQQLLILEGYAERLAYSHHLRALITSARERLNLLSPGAGDFLDDGDAL